MNYYKLAVTVFKKHNKEFIDISLKREKLKTKLKNARYLKKEGVEFISKEEIEKLDKEIKEGIKRLNNLIGGLLNGR